nr:hypothetical protein [Tanacetum cinerariifolium]
MALTFADTHNMIAHLTKSDASEGFEQILYFLNAGVNDVVRLQALIDRRKVIISEDTVRQALRLDDAKSIDCLPNEEIFTELARMGYGKPSTKLTFYKAFFSAQWKFFIHTILQFLTQKVFANIRRVEKGFSGVNTPLFEGILVPHQAADDVDDVVDDSVPADDVAYADAEPTPPSPTTTPPPPQQEFTSTPPSSPHQSPIAQPSSPPQQLQPSQPSHTTTIFMEPFNNFLETFTTLTMKVENLEQDKVAQALKIIKLKQRIRKLERKNKLKVFRALKRTSESSGEKATKKQKLDEEVEQLKKHLQIVPNDDDDDVYTEATPLALKVHVVDYQIHTANYKLYYKIIRADGTHQLFLSFLSLLRNFDREDLEMLWKIVQERFASSKPKNFLDDFLLTTLKAMFEKPVMILLVERRYPLTRFNLDQMLNNVRLEVKEESEVSLELLRFIRRQQQEGYRPELQEIYAKGLLLLVEDLLLLVQVKAVDNAADSRLRLLEQSVAVDDKIKKYH